MTNFTLLTTVVVAKGHLSCDLGGEVAILHLADGIYYGLDPVGARVWSLIQEPRRVGEIQETLVNEFDVEPECCERDLRVLLVELSTHGLIERVDETPA